MYNITAKDYVVPNPEVSGDVDFYYKANYINNGPLLLLKVYKGCYVDSEIRDLPIRLGQLGTIDACLAACAGQSKRYFGVQAG